MLRKVFKLNLSLQLLAVVFAALFFGNALSETTQAFFYAVSVSLKNILLFILPAVIFSCLFSCLLTFRGRRAVGFMLILFAIVCLSNYLSTLIAYGTGALKLIHIEALGAHNASSIPELLPLWQLTLPEWLSNDNALYLGFGLGAFFSFYPNTLAYRFSIQARQAVTVFLEKAFIPILPLFALGFILKMQHDGFLAQLVQSYLSLMLIIVLAYIIYLGFIFLLAANFNPKQWFTYIKNVFPVALMGFSTMSSLATMPVTLRAAEKNTGNIDIARAVIPATVNVHMVGVSLGIPLMALTLLLSFGHEYPSFATYCQFAVYFVLTQFAVAGVPGGAILVLLPLLETHLGFNSEMSVLITALYILFDPVVTTTNVIGNSALVIMVSKLFRFLTGKTTESAIAEEISSI